MDQFAELNCPSLAHTHTHTRALFMEKRRMQPLKVEHTHTLKGLNEFCIR